MRLKHNNFILCIDKNLCAWVCACLLVFTCMFVGELGGCMCIIFADCRWWRCCRQHINDNTTFSICTHKQKFCVKACVYVYNCLNNSSSGRSSNDKYLMKFIFAKWNLHAHNQSYFVNAQRVGMELIIFIYLFICLFAYLFYLAVTLSSILDWIAWFILCECLLLGEYVCVCLCVCMYLCGSVCLCAFVFFIPKFNHKMLNGYQ